MIHWLRLVYLFYRGQCWLQFFVLLILMLVDFIFLIRKLSFQLKSYHWVEVQIQMWLKQVKVKPWKFRPLTTNVLFLLLTSSASIWKKKISLKCIQVLLISLEVLFSPPLKSSKKTLTYKTMHTYVMFILW